MMLNARDHVDASAEREPASRRLARTTIWAFVAEAGGQLVTLVIGLVLAALVGPEEYGIVAMAIVYVLLVELVQRQGIASAVIQRRNLTGAHANTAFWLVVGSSAAMSIVSIALAGWWASVNDVPELQYVVMALTALLPLKAMTTVQEALLRRELDFKKVALRTAGGATAGGVVGISVAVMAPTAWAFVAQQLAAALVSAILLWAVSPWRPRFSFSRAAGRDLLGFSTGSFLSSLGVFINNRIDALLVGVLFGPISAGLYWLASRFIETFLSFVVRPVQSLALPALSPTQDDLPQFRQKLSHLNKIAGTSSLPFLGVLAASATPLLRLLGDSWSPAILPLQILCVGAIIRIFTELNGPILQALGRPHLHAGLTWLTAVASTAIFVTAAVGLRDSAVADQVSGIALSRVVFYVVVIMTIHVAVIRRLVGMSIRDNITPFLPSAISGATAVLCGVTLTTLTTVDSLPPLPHFALVGGCSTVAGGAALILADPEQRIKLSRLFVPARDHRERQSK